MRRSVRFQRGFTLIEAIITIGLSLILLGIGIMALARPQSQASVAATTNILVSELKLQQLRAMGGDSGSQTLAANQGIRIEPNRYIVFTGSAYAGSTNQFTTSMPKGVSFSGATFPLDIIFTKRSGETALVSNLYIRSTAGDQRIININRLGSVNVN